MKRIIKNIWVMTIIILLCSCTLARKSKPDQSGSNSKLENKSPSLTLPKVRKVWVPEKIEGDKYIEGHWMWVLERTTTWSQ